MIVMYNLVIGILVMLASGKIGSYASVIGPTFGRYAKVSVFTFGACVTAVSGTIYIVWHVFRLGLD